MKMTLKIEFSFTRQEQAQLALEDFFTEELEEIAQSYGMDVHGVTVTMERKVEKNYIAVVDGTPTETTGVIDLPLATNRAGRPRQVVDLVSGKPSRTEYQVMGQTRQGTVLNLVPITGRTHQLRVHCAHPTGLSCPIIGDDLYGISPPSTRLLLHANRIKFNHPITQNTVELEAHPTFV